MSAPVDLDALEALFADATPGPWWYDPQEYDGVLGDFKETVHEGGAVVEGGARPICHPGTDEDANELPCADDFVLIEAMHRCTPALISALRVATAALREAADEINRLDPHIQHPSGTGYDAGPALAQIAALVTVEGDAK